MILTCYPTPSSSPVPNASNAVVPTKRLPLHFPESPESVKKRKQCPAINNSSHASVKLDVYKFYALAPDTLLYARTLDDRSSDCDSSTTSSKSVDHVDHESDRAQSIASVAVKSLHQSVGIDDSIDYSLFTNTSDAPIVEKKGNSLLINSKGTPLNISEDAPFYHDLTREEIRTCSTLRMLPEQYLNVKKIMISAVVNKPFFNKRDAQVWFRMDVNKTCLLYGWFKAIGWIPEKENWHLGPKYS